AQNTVKTKTVSPSQPSRSAWGRYKAPSPGGTNVYATANATCDGTHEGLSIALRLATRSGSKIVAAAWVTAATIIAPPPRRTSLRNGFISEGHSPEFVGHLRTLIGYDLVDERLNDRR